MNNAAAAPLAYHIADYSLNFFAKGRAFTVGNDNANFNRIRNMLTYGEHDIDLLSELADPRVAVSVASNGLCTVVGNSVMYEDRPLNNVWVDKILSFKANDLTFEPIMKALANLQENPTEKARLRLPVFVEQSKLGFLPDGRIAALKAVNDNYTDCHTGRFDNKVGEVLTMERGHVDQDPDQECSSGFHLGAYDYVRTFGSCSRRIMLCAFWPRDVVAVPRDYNGQKMRVCSYEVMDEMDRNTLVQFIDDNRNLLRSYEVRMPSENSLDRAIQAVEAEGDEHYAGEDDETILNPEPVVGDDPIVEEGVIVSADKTMQVDLTANTITISDKPKRAYKKRALVKKAVKKAPAKKKKKAVVKKKVVTKVVAKVAKKAPAKKATPKKSAKKPARRR